MGRSPERLAVLLLAFAAPAPAQQSASFDQREHALNCGGNPADGVILTSASYRFTLDALGEAAAAPTIASASYSVGTGFLAPYPPPGEVQNLRMTGTGLTWNPERSRGSYAVYRGVVTNLPADYGSCLSSGQTSESATDAAVPAAGQTWFYLVSVRNRLTEEGRKGTNSSGVPNPNPSPCP